jgi:CBS domain-containing protein
MNYNIVMNILFFMIPKSQVCFAEAHWSLRQVAEKMIANDFTALPIINAEGQYVGAISEGDLFRFIKLKANLNYKEAENTPISSIRHERDVKPIRFDAEMKDLVCLAGKQNFVPVLDENGIFMGIITRQAIIGYLDEKLKSIPDSKFPKSLR